MLKWKRKAEVKEWDREKLSPAIRKSICTGEEVAGFLDKQTGRFSSVMLLRNADDEKTFRTEWAIEGEIRVIY